MKLSYISAPRNRTAFTLVELLVAIGVITILGLIGVNVMQGMQAKAEQTREFAAARTLITAYTNYALDHNNNLLVGLYEGGHSDLNVYKDLPYPDDAKPSETALHRYPYRLAPYFNYQIEGVIILNGMDRIMAKSAFGTGSYGYSMCPAFGLNGYFLGGRYDHGTMANPDETARKMAAVPEPAKMIVFATTFFQDTSGGNNVAKDKRLPGYHLANPPRYDTRFWSMGCNLDTRHGGKVLCVFLDGSIRQESVEALDDMRLWSHRAQEDGNSAYTVKRKGGGGLGGGGDDW